MTTTKTTTRNSPVRRRTIVLAALAIYLGVAILFVVALSVALAPSGAGGAVFGARVAIVELEGTIVEVDDLVRELKAHRDNPLVKAVVLRINSPGGVVAPTQELHAAVMRLRESGKPVVASLGAVAASGGYYVAVAADKIYADKASVVGSVGVLMNGFGFVGAMEKLGIERRLLTAGEHKGFLDPFSPQNPEDADHARELLKAIHSQFIAVVKQGRGARLKDDPRLFTGLVWTGEQGIELGLVDALGDTDSVARDVIKADKVVDYTVRPAYFEKLIRSAGGEAASSLLNALSDGLRWR